MDDLVVLEVEQVEDGRIGLDRQPDELAQLVHGAVRRGLGEGFMDGVDAQDAPRRREENAVPVKIALIGVQAVGLGAADA